MRSQIASALLLLLLLLCLAFLMASTGIDAVAIGIIAGMLAVVYRETCADRGRLVPRRCMSRTLRRIVRRHDWRRCERRVRRHRRRQSRRSMAKVLMWTIFLVQVSNRTFSYPSPSYSFRTLLSFAFYRLVRQTPLPLPVAVGAARRFPLSQRRVLPRRQLLQQPTF